MSDKCWLCSAAMKLRTKGNKAGTAKKCSSGVCLGLLRTPRRAGDSQEVESAKQSPKKGEMHLGKLRHGA